MLIRNQEQNSKKLESLNVLRPSEVEQDLLSARFSSQAVNECSFLYLLPHLCFLLVISLFRVAHKMVWFCELSGEGDILERVCVAKWETASVPGIMSTRGIT